MTPPRSYLPEGSPISISEEEFKAIVWRLIARNSLSPHEAYRRARVRYRPSARSKRNNDGWEEYRARRRITPLEAQRRVRTLMMGFYPGQLGGSTGTPLSRCRRGRPAPHYNEAKLIVLRDFAVMGTWEDCCAYWDELSRRWANFTW